MSRTHDDSLLTADELAALVWWDTLSDAARRAAFQLAKATTVAQAWDWQKAVLENEGFDVKAHYGGRSPDQRR